MYKENKDFLKQSQIDFIEKNIMYTGIQLMKLF